jgi:uncharacterized protein YPO0396
MTTKEYERIKEKIEAAKEKKNKAQGAIEQLKASLKKEFGFDSVEEAAAKEKELATEIETAEKRLESLMEELEGVTEWEKL